MHLDLDNAFDAGELAELEDRLWTRFGARIATGCGGFGLFVQDLRLGTTWYVPGFYPTAERYAIDGPTARTILQGLVRAARRKAVISLIGDILFLLWQSSPL